MGGIKTDLRNGLCNVTLASQMRIKNWLKSEGVTADTALISDDLVNCVAKARGCQLKKILVHPRIFSKKSSYTLGFFQKNP